MAPGIRNRNLAKDSAVRTMSGAFWQLLARIPAADQLSYYFSTAITAAPAGTVVAGSSFYTKTLQSLAISVGGTFGATSITFRVVGENQFGDPITEDFTYAANGTQITARAFRRVTSITILAVVGTIGAALLLVGYQAPATNSSYKLPLLSKIKGGASVKAVNRSDQDTLANQPTFTVNLTTWTINLVHTAAGSANVVPFFVVLDNGDPLL